MRTAVKHRASSLPKQDGEQARLKVAQGPDSGSIFVITGSPVSIGRGDENDVVITDLKASRRHAELSFAAGAWRVKDAGSANGILVNGRNESAANLKSLDTFTMGETTFEFVAADAPAKLLASPARDIQKIRSSQLAFEQQRKAVQSLGGGLSAAVMTAGGSARSSSPLMKAGVIAIVGLGVVFMLPDGKQSPQSMKAGKIESNASRDLASYLPTASMASKEPTNPTVEMFFKTGFREFRERNFLRAKSQFETVLQLSPRHTLAKLYLENCNKEIEDEVQFHLKQGKKSHVSGKLKSAKGHYEAVLRLLFRDPKSPNYLEAKEQLEKIALETAPGGTG